MKKKLLTIEQELYVLDEFAKFCSYIDDSKCNSKTDFLNSVRIHLLSIYTCGLKLPSSYMPDEKDYPDMLTEEKVNEVQNLVVERLGDCRYYWEVFNPSDMEDNIPVCGDLADDIIDIYKDLKRTLLLYSLRTNEAKNTALWQFEFLFRTHWGNHCVNAIRACHYFLPQG